MPAFMDDSLVRSLYKQQIPGSENNPQPPLTYGREYFRSDAGFARRAEWLARLGVDVSSGPILIVGAGFGYLIEALKDHGRDAYGIEPGSFFWSNMATEAEPNVARRIANDWIGSTSDVTSLRRFTSEPFGFIIDEDAAPAHTDNELTLFHARLEQFVSSAPLPSDYRWRIGARDSRARIIHMVTPLDVGRGPGDSSQNWKTLREWKRTARHHVWMDIRNGTIA